MFIFVVLIRYAVGSSHSSFIIPDVGHILVIVCQTSMVGPPPVFPATIGLKPSCRLQPVCLAALSWDLYTCYVLWGLLLDSTFHPLPF